MKKKVKTLFKYFSFFLDIVAHLGNYQEEAIIVPVLSICLSPACFPGLLVSR